MKKLSLIWVFGLFSVSAFAQVFYKSGTFKVIDATESTTYPGVEGSPISHQVRFKLILKTCARLSLDSFWTKGFSDEVRIGYANGEKWDGKPMEGDTLVVSCYYSELPDADPSRPMPAISASPKKTPPVKHKGKFLFRYSLKGKKYYFSISDIKKGENIYAP